MQDENLTDVDLTQELYNPVSVIFTCNIKIIAHCTLSTSEFLIHYFFFGVDHHCQHCPKHVDLNFSHYAFWSSHSSSQKHDFERKIFLKNRTHLKKPQWTSYACKAQYLGVQGSISAPHELMLPKQPWVRPYNPIAILWETLQFFIVYTANLWHFLLGIIYDLNQISLTTDK